MTGENQHYEKEAQITEKDFFEKVEISDGIYAKDFQEARKALVKALKEKQREKKQELEDEYK